MVLSHDNSIIVSNTQQSPVSCDVSLADVVFSEVHSSDYRLVLH